MSAPSLTTNCTTDDLKVCDAACAADWGIWTPPEVDCQP